MLRLQLDDVERCVSNCYRDRFNAFNFVAAIITSLTFPCWTPPIFAQYRSVAKQLVRVGRGGDQIRGTPHLLCVLWPQAGRSQ